MSTTTTDPASTPAPTVSQRITAMLLELAGCSLLIDQLQKSQQIKIEAIRKATDATLAPHILRRKALEAEIKLIAEDPANKGELFEKIRTFTAQGHAVSLRRTTSYVAEDEEGVIALLEHARDNHEDDATRVLAAGCLRTDVSLNKDYIKDNWKRFGHWFGSYFGITRRMLDKASIKLDLTPEGEP